MVDAARNHYHWQSRRVRISNKVRTIADTLPLPDGWFWWTTIGSCANGDESWATIAAPDGDVRAKIRGKVVLSSVERGCFIGWQSAPVPGQLQWMPPIIMTRNLQTAMTEVWREVLAQC